MEVTKRVTRSGGVRGRKATRRGDEQVPNASEDLREELISGGNGEDNPENVNGAEDDDGAGSVVSASSIQTPGTSASAASSIGGRGGRGRQRHVKTPAIRRRGDRSQSVVSTREATQVTGKRKRDDEVEWEVEKILNKRKTVLGGGVDYLVHWKNYPEDQSTWEPFEHVNGCVAVNAFEDMINALPPAVPPAPEPVNAGNEANVAENGDLPDVGENDIVAVAFENGIEGEAQHQQQFPAPMYAIDPNLDDPLQLYIIGDGQQQDYPFEGHLVFQQDDNLDGQQHRAEIEYPPLQPDNGILQVERSALFERFANFLQSLATTTISLFGLLTAFAYWFANYSGIETFF